MLFPISDDDREVSTKAYVTYSLVAANVLFFLIQMSNPEFTYGWSVIPREITTGVDLIEPQVIESQGQRPIEIPQAPGPPFIWFTLITSMFMHGGFGHIAGNMLYLWIFGNNVEHRFGHGWFLAFYLLAGLMGSAAQIALFVAPVLVLLSYVIGPTPMDLQFWPGAVVMVLIATITASLVTNSGRSAWFIGILVLMVYTIFAMTLYLLPPRTQ